MRLLLVFVLLVIVQWGYSGRESECDFEDTGMCSWTDQSLNASAYRWERRQRGDTMPDSGPTSDFTTGTAVGWFMGVTSVQTDPVSIAVFMSPPVNESSPTCRLVLQYFLWDSAGTGLGFAPLWASILRQDSEEAVVWRPEVTSVRAWREATIFLGRIPTSFQIRISSKRSEGQRGDVAIDQLQFLDCAFPVSDPGTECPPEGLKCRRGGCVERRQICDGTDDCDDGTDEDNCGAYRLCDFEQDLCDWDLRSLSTLKWVRRNQKTISNTDLLKGPGRDHSNNTVSGYFLYVTVPDSGLRMDWAAFQSPLLDPTNSSHPCKMVMYTHQFGPRSGGLTVLVADRRIYPVWERGGALGDLWVKAEVDIVTDTSFKIVVMAAIRDFSYGGIAVDSIMLSPDCRLSSENDSMASFPNSPEDPCTEPDKLCDFYPDCASRDDETKCGDFSYPQGSSGWTDSSVGTQGWLLNKNSTTKDEYLIVVDASGQQLTEAQTRTPLLGPSGPACTLSFDFALTGTLDSIGELSVRVIDSAMGVRPKTWEFSGKTGTEAEAWQHASVSIGLRKNRFQLAFEARAMKRDPRVQIKVKNVKFVNCHALYLPSYPSGLSCNFEDGLCDWYQDKSDNFDWTVLEGMDHTIGNGRSLALDMWSPSLHGAFGRLLSLTQPPISTKHCLSFFYKIYGTNTGVLNVKLFTDDNYETVLWTSSGAQGNMWHEGHCSVPQQLTPFQLMFEAVRCGFDGQVAIDDVAFVAKPCAMPERCTFEGQQCGYSNSGRSYWVHRNGHPATITGPKTDHTLETEEGFYMAVNTGSNNLPPGSTAVLTSPIHKGTTKTQCLQFWYHKGGENPGSLVVYMKPVKGERVKIFSNTLNLGDGWRHGNANISSALVDWELEFEVVGAGGKDSHITVDDIILSDHPCEAQSSKCTLERGTCSWTNTQNTNMDKLDWDLTSYETEKHYSTPTHDHTLGTEKGHFLFFWSTSRTPHNETAKLLSPHLPPTKGTCLTFWALKPPSADSQLQVWTLSKSQPHQILLLSEVGSEWKHFAVNITSAEEYQIVLEAVKGSMGFLALDDIQYTVGVNCARDVTDPQPTKSKGDNAGGIAASVIVVLLLLATLLTLLFFYLRSRQSVQSGNSPSSSPAGFMNETYDP
ncbi:apical endosomal glycoprotein [Thalassophryne amazonica]|uniref:apical endosomal glycoprotein n=1 Tax=Thalassophryne amazonica TaxID=390379 RepID=UPI001471B537|nr:apical endosomal glycoprotein [Thalassophryne amazonica]